MGEAGYTRPEIKDHGSLAALTADFDVNFVGAVTRVVSLATVSTPTVPVDPGGGGPKVDTVEPPVMGGPDPGGPGPGGPDPGGPGPGPDPGDPTPGGPDDGPDPDGGQLPESPDSAPDGDTPQGDRRGAERTFDLTSAPGDAQGGVLGESAEGGRLPFTGYWASTMAAIGATLTTSGIALRARLRRRD